MATSPSQTRSSHRQPGTRTILVGDREDQSRTVTAAILRRLGFQVAEADSSRTVLSHARGGAHTCAILDVNLSDQGPFDLCRRLLETPGWTWTPVILTGARSLDPQLRMSLQQSGVAYLSRPFRSDQLLASVGDALASSAPLRQARPDRRLALAQAESASG